MLSTSSRRQFPDTPSALLFTAAATKHYQWMLRTDFLPRIVDPDIVTDVFTNGRKVLDRAPEYDDPALVPGVRR